MFITVRFGNDQRQIFNPDCAVINLLDEIKRKCKVVLSKDVDLTDETGLLVGISKAKPFDRGSRFVMAQNTYVLVEKRETASENAALSSQEKLRLLKARLAAKGNDHASARSGRSGRAVSNREHYFPLLLCINQLYPDYFLHRSLEEKKLHARKVAREHKNSTPTRESSPGPTRKTVMSPNRLRNSGATRRHMTARRLTIFT